MMQLTDAEIAFLLKQPDVANTLARFNRAQALQSACLAARMQYLSRVRTFEKLDQNCGPTDVALYAQTWGRATRRT